jgi:hypothetical protein
MKTLANMHMTNNGFKARLYQRWKEPLDLLELLINSSMEIGQDVKRQLVNNRKKISNPKHVALIKIHARAIQVANEILTLLKAGYADGANGRWRTLYELTPLFLFLRKESRILFQ